MINKRKKVLVTGGQGFIGSNLVPVLAKKHRVITFDKKEKHDLFNHELEGYIAESDAVIHLAALVSVGKSFDKPSDTFYTNVVGTARVAEFCVKYKKKLIYPSSAAVYHPELSPYAHSKKVGEDIVWGLRRKIPVTILRLFNVYGSNMNPGSGSIMYNFLTSKKISIYGDGEGTRDFINVKDVANIMVDALKRKWDGQMVDVGTGEAYSTNFIADTFRYFRGLDKVYYDQPRREIKWSVADRRGLDELYKEPLVTDVVRDIEELCRK